jgi:WD40 repeat protein
VAAESPEAAADAVAWALDRVGEAERRRTDADHDLQAALILVVDQLENLFGTDGQKQFSGALRGLVAGGRVWLLTTVRSDRYADLQVDPALLTLKRNGATYDLPPPGPAEITDIIKGPARAAGLAFAERDGRSLARVLVEAMPNADALPLLQMTLSQLFDRGDGETLGFEAYDAIGGIEGAIAAHANAVFASASAAVRRELDPLLRVLVSDVSRRPNRTVRFIARAADRKSFETSAPRRDLINLLVEGRLLVSDGTSIRVAHEALLRRWDLARRSVERIADAELRKARLRTLVAVAAAFVFLAIGVYAWSQQNVAIKQTQLAEKQTQLAQAEAQAAAASLVASRARQASTQSPQLGVLLAAEAVQRLQAKSLPVTTASAQTLVDILKQVSGVGLRGHRLEPLADARGSEAVGTFISAIAISPDSKWIATGDGDGRVVLRQRAKSDVWVELAPGKPTRFGDSKEEIYSLEFSKDSTRLAATKFGEAIVWQISGRPTEIARCAVGNDYVYEAHFAGGNQWLVTAAGSGIQVWDTETTPPKAVVLPESHAAYRAVLAAKDEFVVSALGHIWRWRDHTLVAQLPGVDKFFSMAVSPQGDKVAFGTSEGKVHVWWLNTKEHKTFDQGGLIESVTFSPDGNGVGSASSNRTAQIWDLTGQHKALTFEHPGEVRSIAFHPSGHTVATVGHDRRVRLWSTYWLYTPSPTELGGLTGNGDGSHLAFSPDGSYLVAGGFEPLARLWPLNALNPGAQVFRGSSYGAYESVTPSNNPQRIAAVTRNAGPDLWDLDRPDAPPTALADARNNGSQVALSRDGKWLASSGVAASSYLWKIATPTAKARELLASTGYHNKVLFSPDSSLVAGMHKDGSIILESTTDSARLSTKLAGATEPAVDFDFHPAGTHVAAIYRNGTAFLWDVRGTTREQLTSASENREAASVSFADDGKHVALGGAGFIEWRDLARRSSIHLAAPKGRALTKIAIASNAPLVAAGTQDGTTLVWDLLGSIVPHELLGHGDKIIGIAFAPDGQSLASATQKSIRVWSLHDFNAAPIRLDLEQMKAFYEKTSDDSSAISSIAFLKNGQIAASTTNHLVVEWDLDWAHLAARACETAGRSFSAREILDYLDGAPATACLPASRQR